jgi:hypothetical protein
MSDPNSMSSDILSDGPIKDILRPALTQTSFIPGHGHFVKRGWYKSVGGGGGSDHIPHEKSSHFTCEKLKMQ